MQTIIQIEGNLEKMQNWMNYNRLNLIQEKLELIRFGTEHQLQKCNKKKLTVCRKKVKISDLVRYLGAWFASMLIFKDHLTMKYKSAMLNLK